MLMQSERIKASVRAFWKWFLENADAIEKTVDIEDPVACATLLSAAVAKISSAIGWEIGPGVSGKHRLSVSLNGDIGNLPLAIFIVSEAPLLPNWEFHAGRPPKEWDMQFEMTDANGNSVDIDSRSWSYSLVAYNDCEFFDMKLFAPNLPKLDEIATRQAAGIAVHSMLGEIEFLRRIEDIQVVRATPSEDAPTSDLSVLRDHIQSLTSK